MKVSTQTRPRLGKRRRRRRKKQPDPLTALRVEWLRWLVQEYGPDSVAEWRDPPVRFRDWKRARELEAYEAA